MYIFATMMQVFKNKIYFFPKSLTWDHLGIGTSLLCAAHCAILPLFVSSMPVFGMNVIENKWIEAITFLFSFVFGFAALRRRHADGKNKLLLLMFCAGFIALITSQVMDELEWILVPVAALLITAAHLLNLHHATKNKN